MYLSSPRGACSFSDCYRCNFAFWWCTEGCEYLCIRLSAWDLVTNSASGLVHQQASSASFADADISLTCTPAQTSVSTRFQSTVGHRLWVCYANGRTSGSNWAIDALWYPFACLEKLVLSLKWNSSISATLASESRICARHSYQPRTGRLTSA